MRRKPKKCYLVGAMEQVKDDGIGWRDRIKKKLEDIDLDVLDPCERESEKTGYEVAESKRLAYGWKRSGQLEKVTEMFKKIIHVDLKAVRTSDFLILKISPEDKVGGTISELTIAYELGVPVYCYLEGAISEMNSWVLSLILLNGEIFRTWEELITKVREVCK
jgi:nucleoside 2-deoxyribosyltransferase